MPTFLETLGFIVYLSVMYGGRPNRDVLAAAYAQPVEGNPHAYRGIRSVSLMEDGRATSAEDDISEAAA